MSKTLVTYFSATGTTEKTAKKLADAIGADLYEIRPAVPYTAADLDWQNARSRSTVEMKDPASRPTLADKDAPVAAHDTVFVGFPIWWYVAPTVINSFLESYDFAGKTVVLFATSGGSGLGKTAAALRDSLSRDTRLVEGKVLSARQSEADLAAWVRSLGL